MTVMKMVYNIVWEYLGPNIQLATHWRLLQHNAQAHVFPSTNYDYITCYSFENFSVMCHKPYSKE